MAKKFSKTFIKKKKESLLKDREETLRQIEELKKDDPFADPDHASDNAAIDTDVREQVGHDTIQAQIKSLNRKIEFIERAFEKIAKNKYGVCERCENQIPSKRLDLIPEAKYCINCEQELIQ
ncbi:MAG: TraR/DksA C4-type zinc finger protein [Patescibacteria group bacterium]